jgi:predicted DNA-binding transcriptional regulator AlpA
MRLFYFTGTQYVTLQHAPCSPFQSTENILDTNNEQYLRVANIIGDKTSKPPILGIINMSPSGWYSLVKQGIAPRAIKIGRASFWRKSDVISFIENASRSV